ncbi:MAG TPA: P63C domain-containing protein [Microvirga sp.]|jgi:hypothetical protein
MNDHSDGEPTGRAKGGHARASKLTREQRSEIARRGGLARQGKDSATPILMATHGSEDHPLRIGDIELPCYVLEDGRRVLHQRGMVRSLGMSRGGSSRGGGDRLAYFTAQRTLEPFVSKNLVEVTKEPIKFRTPRGALAYGYEATVLADICDAILEARKAGVLQKQQEHIAQQAEILVRGFARVGIIALVDEATGFQHDRARDALARILEAFIAKELQPYVQTFPAEFYAEMFRLRGLEYPNGSVKRPQYFGILTNDIVYRRLAPGVLEELKKATPRSEDGRPKAKYFQSLTSNIGYPKLREHLGSVVTMMRLSDTWQQFMARLDRFHPRYGETLQLPLEDTGKGF